MARAVAEDRSRREFQALRISDDETVPFEGGPIVIKKREAGIEADGVAYAVARGWKHKKIGTNSWPDHLFVKEVRRVKFVEFKRPGEKPRPNQAKRLKELREMGFECHVVDRKEQYANVFGA
jgi:hypothetical protein